jgi:hypothetical protein
MSLPLASKLFVWLIVRGPVKLCGSIEAILPSAIPISHNKGRLGSLAPVIVSTEVSRDRVVGGVAKMSGLDSFVTGAEEGDSLEDSPPNCTLANSAFRSKPCLRQMRNQHGVWSKNMSSSIPLFHLS